MEQYETIQFLGKGSYGQVFEVEHKVSLQRFAMKLLEKQKVKLRSLQGEAKILEILEHPNIVKFHHFEEEENNCFFIMDLMKGGSLTKYIKENEQLTESDYSILIKYILQAVDYIHSKNIIHRDLKPDNIMLREQNNLKTVSLVDFGFGAQYQVDSSNKCFSKFCGTLLFMAPELFGQKAYSKQVDVYSVGIIMAWMLNKGKHPLFRSDDNEATYKQRVMNPKWRLRNFSNCAKDFFEKMVDPDPTTRFTANLAINHPWITRSEHVDIPLTSVQCIDTYDTQKTFFKIIRILMLVQKCQNTKQPLEPCYRDRLLTMSHSLKKDTSLQLGNDYLEQLFGKQSLTNSQGSHIKIKESGMKLNSKDNSIKDNSFNSMENSIKEIKFNKKQVYYVDENGSIQTRENETQSKSSIEKKSNTKISTDYNSNEKLSLQALAHPMIHQVSPLVSQQNSQLSQNSQQIIQQQQIQSQQDEVISQKSKLSGKRNPPSRTLKKAFTQQLQTTIETMNKKEDDKINRSFDVIKENSNEDQSLEMNDMYHQNYFVQEPPKTRTSNKRNTYTHQKVEKPLSRKQVLKKCVTVSIADEQQDNQKNNEFKDFELKDFEQKVLQIEEKKQKDFQIEDLKDFQIEEKKLKHQDDNQIQQKNTSKQIYVQSADQTIKSMSICEQPASQFQETRKSLKIEVKKDKNYMFKKRLGGLMPRTENSLILPKLNQSLNNATMSTPINFSKDRKQILNERLNRILKNNGSQKLI